MKYVKLFEEFATLDGTPGMGAVVPPGAVAVGSGDTWGSISKFAKKARKKRKKVIAEGHDVAVIDMREEAEKRVAEACSALEAAAGELYEIVRMAEDVKAEYPTISKEVLNTLEPMMGSLENVYPRQLKALLNKFV